MGGEEGIHIDIYNPSDLFKHKLEIYGNLAQGGDSIYGGVDYKRC